EMFIRFALTGKMSEKGLKEIVNPIWKQYACNESFLMKPGTIEEKKGIEKIKEIPGVVDAVLAHDIGDTLPEEAKGMLKQIMLRVFATAQTEEELKKLLDDVYHSLEVYGENDENLLLDGLDISEIEGALL